MPSNNTSNTAHDYKDFLQVCNSVEEVYNFLKGSLIERLVYRTKKRYFIANTILLLQDN